MPDSYIVLDRDVGAPMVHHAAYLAAAFRCEHDELGVDSGPWLFEYRNRAVRYTASAAGIRRVSEAVIDRFSAPAFLGEIERKQRATIEDCLAFVRPLATADYSRRSPVELADLFGRIYPLWVAMTVPGHWINFTDYEYELLSEKVLGLLSVAIQRSGHPSSATKAFSVLIAPQEQSAVQRSEQAFYSLLAAVQSTGAKPSDAAELLTWFEHHPKESDQLRTYLADFDWLPFNYDGPTILESAAVAELLVSELRQGTRGAERVTSIAEAPKQHQTAAAALATVHGLTADERHWVNVARQCLLLKAIRKDAVYEASRCMEPFYRAVGRTLNLSRTQVRHLAPHELTAALHTGEADADLLNERVKYSVWTNEGGEQISVVVGQAASDWSAKIAEHEVDESAMTLTGSSAFPGRAEGIVRIVATAQDMGTMKTGDILVAPATNPNVVPAMKKAAAIVTDVGGVTCHAAIMSRELKIPCVIGTKVATRFLKEGDRVRVDAVSGVVTILERA